MLMLLPPDAVTVGWDDRPRQLYPVPWGGSSCSHGPGECWVEDPTMPELTEAVAVALNFTRTHQSGVTAANTIVIRCVRDPMVLIIVRQTQGLAAHRPACSAWDEYDEGHWIAPSLLNGTAKLDAVQRAIASP